MREAFVAVGGDVASKSRNVSAEDLFKFKSDEKTKHELGYMYVF